MGLIFKFSRVRMENLKIWCVFEAKSLEMGIFFFEKIPTYGYLFLEKLPMGMGVEPPATCHRRSKI